MRNVLERLFACLLILCLALGLVSVPQAVALADGVYPLQGFSFSGGTGKVKITCGEITVTDGEIWAEIFFSSSTWSYVRIGQEKYLGDVVEGKSRFFIPVRLGENNVIYALTTRMSSPHEVEYTLFFQLASQESRGPEIMGLTFLEEIPLERASHLRLHRYQGDVTLIEIDTGFQGPPAPEIPTEDRLPVDDIAALYRNRVLRYLLVPRGFSLPAGLEKEYIVIEKPLERVLNFTRDTSMGTPEQPNYRSIILNKIQAVLADETMPEAMVGTVTDRFATLGIPVIFHCAGLEEAGQADWDVLHQLLFEGE